MNYKKDNGVIGIATGLTIGTMLFVALAGYSLIAAVAATL